ncbi:MAG TPA: subclass B3 metallo-beta-lactamase [Xanthomonadaceae bacterium]|nr:subclass B3 metallo-beta-lactamase [Xanthomonadaceae bacterium]
MNPLAPALALILAAAAPVTPVDDTTPIDCGSCPGWNAAQAPFQIHGNTWYVGPRGLSAILIDSGAGLVLVDGALPQSAPAIERNIQTLGFDIRDVRWILVSHEHFDHAGGIAALARMSGARVAASPAAAAALRRGNVRADDPQAGFGNSMRFPPVPQVVEVADGGTVTLGGLVVTAVHSPGHTPGGSSWHWHSCRDTGCATVVYADSLTAVSAPDYRYSDHPELLSALRATIERIAALDCDVLIATHPESVRLWERRELAEAGEGTTAYVDAGACGTYAQAARAALERRLARERTAPGPR